MAHGHRQRSRAPMVRLTLHASASSSGVGRLLEASDERLVVLGVGHPEVAAGEHALGGALRGELLPLVHVGEHLHEVSVPVVDGEGDVEDGVRVGGLGHVGLVGLPVGPEDGVRHRHHLLAVQDLLRRPSVLYFTDTDTHNPGVFGSVESKDIIIHNNSV
eukprot:TRINITY_DN18270_c0_g1_i2.p1 TRINITY_DN18270_c0_g1~~TRINITY_DN18270_c0_g1_i2.p1  ORF type:complete len:160 (+),score=5.15 TRINITY_DN18270_c0_g1_i2:106-585(+)